MNTCCCCPSRSTFRHSFLLHHHRWWSSSCCRWSHLHPIIIEIIIIRCKNLSYEIDKLPATSVIICFHNEAWSVLIRTIRSVLDRSPPQLISEIILVDDFSDKPHLKQPLDDYAASFPDGKIKVVRAQKREGLIRARLLGFEVASGPVVTYLDSHCEVSSVSLSFPLNWQLLWVLIDWFVENGNEFFELHHHTFFIRGEWEKDQSMAKWLSHQTRVGEFRSLDRSFQVPSPSKTIGQPSGF